MQVVACGVGRAWRESVAAREAPFLDLPKAGAPPCVFMTGVTKNVAKYFPGVRCIMQRLHDLHSRYPLVLAVSADEAEQAQAELDASTVCVWTEGMDEWLPMEQACVLSY